MRSIGTLADREEAERFRDFLLTVGIENKVEEGSEGWVIWVRDEDQVEEAAREFREYLADPAARRYRKATGTATTMRSKAERAARRRDKNIIDVRRTWFHQTHGIGRLTLVLIVLSVAVAVATRLGTARAGLMEWLLIASPKSWALGQGLGEIAHGQVWRLVTPIFIHFGFIHLLFNLYWTRDFGTQIETRKGTIHLGIIVLVSAVASNLAQCWWSGPFAGGMSGVGYALFGYLWMKSRFQPHEGLVMHRTVIYLFIGWLFFCMTGWIGPIGNAAHVTGLVVGVLMGYLPYRFGRAR